MERDGFGPPRRGVSTARYKVRIRDHAANLFLERKVCDSAFICLHAGGLVAECGYCGCLVDEHWDFCARCGTHFMDRRYVAELRDLDV